MSDSLIIRYLEPGDAEALAAFHVRNREHLAPTSPGRPENFFTFEYQLEEVSRHVAERHAGRRYVYGVWLEGVLIARIALNEVIRGAFQNAFIGYMADKDHLNRGLTTRAVQTVLRQAFTELNLHRVEASILPENRASQRVVEKCGFKLFGLAEKHLHIDGAWRDHYIYYLTAERFAQESWASEAPTGT